MEDGEQEQSRKNAVLSVLSIIVVGLLIWSASEQSNWYESNAANRSRYYARDAERQIAEHCSIAPAIDRAKCVDEAVDAARKHQREEQDLAAQKVSAWWTRIMGGAAITGMILSALGVYLVWATFRETRKTASAAIKANQIAMIDRQPSVHVEHIEFEEKDDGSISATFNVRNYGASEAKGFGVSCLVGVGPHPIPDEPPDNFNEAPNPGKPVPPGGTRGTTIAHEDFAKHRNDVLAEKAMVIFGARVVYKDSFGSQFDETFWYYTTGEKFVRRIVSDCDKWTEAEAQKVA